MRLSTTFKTKTGDTFEKIARIKYGTESQTSLIANANPGISEPIPINTILIIPLNPKAPKRATKKAIIKDQDEVTVLINDVRFSFWSQLKMVLTMDSVASITFTAPFEPDNVIFRKTFKPFSYQTVDINIGEARIFTGVLISVQPPLEPRSRVVTVNAYALTGVLNDCSAPASASSQLEFKEQGVGDIAEKMAGFFGIGVQLDEEQGAIFDTVACNPSRKILDFIAELTKQRNLILSNTSDGRLLIWKATKPGHPVARLAEGQVPLVSVTPIFNEQTYFSHITGVEPVTLGESGSQFTVKNPLLNELRPETFIAQDTNSGGLKAATEAKAGRMFGNMVSYQILVATWRDSSGQLWQPNTTVMLLAEGAMIYREYEFIIRSVSFNADSRSKVAVLNLVLPSAFSGELPETLPWD